MDSDTFGLFYYYRQHKLSVDSGMSLLLFLNTLDSGRAKSFDLLNNLETIFGEGLDPRAGERANKITKEIIIEYIKSILHEFKHYGRFNFEIVDLGSGSGMLAAHICRKVNRYLLSCNIEVSMHVCMIDLSMAEPRRFFKGKDICRAIDQITSIRSDYRKLHWDGFALPKTNSFRVGLVSRVLNNMSEFSIKGFRSDELDQSGKQMNFESNWETCLPDRCLDPEATAPKNLVMSNRALWIGGGKSFWQLSLSNYFKALDLCSEASKNPGDIGKIFLPIRSFNPDCLLTTNRESILEKYLESIDMLIIQDSDLTPNLLKEHRRFIKSADVVAIDLTGRLGLRRHFCYVLLRECDRSLTSLVGDRLW